MWNFMPIVVTWVAYTSPEEGVVEDIGANRGCCGGYGELIKNL
jgi:hypothetical protein